MINKVNDYNFLFKQNNLNMYIFSNYLNINSFDSKLEYYLEIDMIIKRKDN